jgi:hypothetical protein
VRAAVRLASGVTGNRRPVVHGRDVQQHVHPGQVRQVRAFAGAARTSRRHRNAAARHFVTLIKVLPDTNTAAAAITAINPPDTSGG